jgi:hypothetical protein
MIDVPSKQIPKLKLVDTGNPEKSYLLMKLRDDEDAIGERMPLGADPLGEPAMAAIEAWVRAVSASAKADTAAVAPEEVAAPDAVEETEAEVDSEAPDDPGNEEED